MLSCSPAISARMGQLVRLLATNHLGELASTRDALQRTLRGVGGDLNDLAEVIERATARIEPALPRDVDRPIDQSLARHVIHHHRDALSDWDLRFLESLSCWRGRLTEKQCQKLAEIWAGIQAGGRGRRAA